MIQNNASTVQRIYEAFGRGDVAVILEHLDAAVEWEYTDGHGVPWLERRKGKEGAAKFFALVQAEMEIHSFAVKQVLAGEGLVAAVVEIDFTVKRTSRKVHEVDEVHLWHFNPEGRIVKFRHVVDSFAHVKAWER
jgi:ketosteroid isomerase-like protein